MVKHMIIWKLKLTGEELEAQKKLIKNGLEGLAGKIPGMTDIHVQIENLPTSNADMMLDSSFETVEALAGYQVNPLHVEAATYVRSVVESRLCLDYEI